ncbi:extracellular solute-binding protein [Agreia pratensis]|uniref:Carbohydrate ABC transporter substrate-binding protein, CUT1 family n=1 Tax=Agreia pratensis TaxID=150121 RepID=A0A1X7JGQ4_9MICO|nr:sugar ABC transporter substrate-binding protein [Agreia pratensis]MBF4634988.1 extracellular solute-binding protein [Agreia pratensis]SMG26943.1 carbohydrate ABC transporter substrate-binding protein, CUT1 family [Agreia pratensis]
MKIRSTRRLRRGAAALTGVLALGLALSACSSAGGSAETGNADDIAKALDTETTITVWAWAPAVEQIAKDFEKEHPKITVNVVNAGTGNDQYVKLQNAIKAGSGAPDVAQIEYYALPQFALSDSLVDLKGFGFDSFADKYTDSTWNSVSLNNGIYALPQDSGPMALFYNKAVFDQYGIAVPTTWDEYVAAAKQLHAADPTKYITNDTGDAGFTTSMIWQAGGQPYKTEKSTDVSINLQDAGSKKFADTWSQLVEGGLVSPITSWSDEWYKGLGDGSIATLTIGAWMPGNLESGVAQASGDWRVAPMPTWEKGQAASAENGGGGDAILKQSKNKLAAAGFLQYMNEGDGTQTSIAKGGFPSTVADLNNDSFLNYESPYFGGQKINQVLVQSSKDVVKGWQYLPFQVYSNSIFNDTVGKAYANKSDLNAGLEAWQKATADYGNEQGFTVKTGN